MAELIDDAFLQLVNANLGIAHKVCRLYFDDEEDREDALQEMMYQLYRSYKSFHGGSKFSTWMYSVCLNTALTFKRKAKNKKTEALSSEHHQIPEPPKEGKHNAIAVLYDVIATLPPLNKAIILLYLEDMSYEEIAGITGLSKSNVSVKLVRIKKELETLMKKKINSIEDVNI
jgi:RNA polymerase sigma-70 factor (ECF subfamily)